MSIISERLFHYVLIWFIIYIIVKVNIIWEFRNSFYQGILSQYFIFICFNHYVSIEHYYLEVKFILLLNICIPLYFNYYYTTSSNLNF